MEHKTLWTAKPRSNKKPPTRGWKVCVLVLFSILVAAIIISVAQTKNTGTIGSSMTPIITEVLIEKKPQLAVVSAYSEFDSCHYENCVMASGKRAYVGAAACPRSVPFGTKVEIDGQIYTCEDRTAKRYDGRYDIFMGYGNAAHKKALQWGLRTLNVYERE